MAKLKIKRVYLPAEEDDGQRILVDRLWPRGMKKADAHVDLWLKEAAPTPELRKWYHQDLARYEEFQEYYKKELRERPETGLALAEITARLQEGDVTLLYGAKDEEQNHARVLQAFLLENDSPA